MIAGLVRGTEVPRALVAAAFAQHAGPQELESLWVVNTRSEPQTNRPRNEEPPTSAAGRRTTSPLAAELVDRIRSCAVVESQLEVTVLRNLAAASAGTGATIAVMEMVMPDMQADMATAGG